VQAVPHIVKFARQVLALIAIHLVQHVGQGRSDNGQVMGQVFPVARCPLLLASRVGRLHRLLPARLALQQRLERSQPLGAFLQPGAIEAQ